MGIVVKADSPFKSFADLIEFARHNPKKLTYGSAGTNSMQYIIIEQIAKREKIQSHIFLSRPRRKLRRHVGGHIILPRAI